MGRIVLALGLFVLVACGDSPPPITQGEIINKEYEPAHWEGGYETSHEYGFHCETHLGFDEEESGYTCHVGPYAEEYWEPHHHWIEDNWSIQIDGCVEYEDDGETREHCTQRWITVSERDYDRYQIGTWYPRLIESQGR